MKNEVKMKLLDARKCLIDMATLEFNDTFTKKRLDLVIEAIDDALENKIHFPKKNK